MPNKRTSSNSNAVDGASPANKKQKTNANPSQTSSLEIAQGLRKTNHGVIFQLKLLMLFLIRGISAGHTFRLGTEMEDIAGKFDDLIFKYEVDGSTSNGGKRYRYRYLQAKHKQDVSFQITASQLLNVKDGDFSLLKYFRSYCTIRDGGNEIEDCIICTNVNFNLNSLQDKGIRLDPLQTVDQMFTFSDHQVKRYKITFKPNAKSEWNATDQDVSDFFNKLVFIVNMPNEVALGQLLTNQVGELYKLHEANFVSDYILRNMLDWFKQRKSDFMTSEQGNDILQQCKQNLKSLGMTSMSINYQKELRKKIEFNEEAIAEMIETLKTMLSSPNKIERLKTVLPERTAVKLSRALKKVDGFSREDSYLMTSFNRLKEASKDFADILKSKHCYQLFVVVCRDGEDENDGYFENLIEDKPENRKVIILCSSGVGASDNLKFADLSDKCKTVLLEKKVSFQGTIQTVGDLVQNGNREEVIDAHSIEELLLGDKTVDIPLHKIHPGFDQDLYIQREIILPFDDKCFEELATEIHSTRVELQTKFLVTAKNNIEWLVDHSDKSKIWNSMKKVLRKRQHSIQASRIEDRISEQDLTLVEEWQSRVVVVSEVAGTGKSTMLSNYCKKIREDTPDSWIIRLDLVDYIKALHQFNSDELDQPSEAIHFFIRNIPNVQESPLAQSLLTHRLKTGEKIVVMLDGFDEIDDKCQDKCLALIKAIRLTKLNALYITSRPHLNEKLQDSLFQFAYALADFSAQDQINYLSRYWEKHPRMFAHPNVRSVAASIVDRLSNSLKDNERSFIGIPLQCHIVAECFESQVCDIVNEKYSTDSLLQYLDSNLDLGTLYERLFAKKRDIYEQEKAKVQNVDNHILHGSLKDQMEYLELYLRDLAVKTIVSDQTQIDCLLGESNDSLATIRRREEKQQTDSVCFGLLTLAKDGFQFLHRTYAEYLMANYLYEGFHLKEDRRNKLLDKQPVSELIGSVILAEEHYRGVQLFFNSKLREIVSLEEWRIMWRPTNRVIPYSELPLQFQNFANDLHRVAKASKYNALTVAIERKNDNTFEFLCRFVDLTLGKSEKLELMQPLFRSVESEMEHRAGRNNLLALFYTGSNCDGFQRLIDWHSGADTSNILLMAKAIYVYAPFLQYKKTRLNQANQKLFFYQLLGFMIQSGQIVGREIIRHDQLHNRAFFCWHKLLKLFLFHEDYETLLQQLLQLLLQTAGVTTLRFIINKTFQNHRDLFKEPILEKLSNALIEMERTDVVAQIPREILLMSPTCLRCVYKHHQQCDRSKWPPERNSTMMERFHEKVYLGDTKAVEDIFNIVSKDLHSLDPEKKKVAEEVVRYMTYRSGSNDFTLSYLALVCGQEDMFRVMLQFVNNVVPRDELHTALISKNGFLHGVFWDAFDIRRIELLRTILSAVKDIMGPESQLSLIKSRRLEIDHKSNLINVLVKAVMENDPTGMRYFDDLMFHDKRNIQLLQHLDRRNLLESRSTEEFKSWMKRLLHVAIEVPEDFISLLSDYLLVMFNKTEVECFLETITSRDQQTDSLSLWAKFVRRWCKDDQSMYSSYLKAIFEHISQKVSENAVKELVLSDDGRVVEWVTLRGYKEMLDAMLAALPTIDQEQAKNNLANNKHQIVFNKFLSVICWQESACYSNIVQVIYDCFEDGSSEQLSNLVDSVTDIYDIQDKKFSLWNNYTDNFLTNEEYVCSTIEYFMELVAEKLDTKAIEKLMLHDIGKGTFFVRFLLWEETSIAWDILKLLPASLREQLDNYLKEYGPFIIQRFFFENTTEKLIRKMHKLGDKFSTNILQFFLDYGNEEQLNLFTDTVTFTYCVDNTHRSLWGTGCRSMLGHEGALEEFFECVSKKIGAHAVKKLLFHTDNHPEDVFIIYALRKLWRESCVLIMFAYLDDDGRDEVRRLVDCLSSHMDVTRYGHNLKDNWHKVVEHPSEQLPNET